MKQIKIDLSFALLALCLASCLASCLDEKLLGTTTGNPSLVSDEKDMFLKVNVPYTYANGEGTDEGAKRETKIETLDVLVFAPGPDNGNGETYYVRAACKGVATGDNFQVVMPIGKELKVHIFANCHDELVAQGFYSKTGLGMNSVLEALLITLDVNATEATALPMHGYRSNVTIDKEQANQSLTIPVLRSVASAVVTTRATISEGVITPGDVTGFELREFYAFFQAASGRVAPNDEAYNKLLEGETDETRSVAETTLPTDFSVKDADSPIKLSSETPEKQLGALYFYENNSWTKDGSDLPSLEQKAATTRLVVGGVYKDAENPNLEDKVTYYRVDITNSQNELASILRNHRYIFNIESVSGPGANTPAEAAKGASVNIYVNLIDWSNEFSNVDFDRENYFYSQSKNMVLPRTAKATRTIKVDSDVPVDQWAMSFEDAHNGASTLTADGNTLSNGRFKVTKTATTLTVEVLKNFNDALVEGETLLDVLKIKVHNLTITFHLSQVNKSLDDWGNGGEGGSNVGGRDEEGVIDGATKDDWGDTGTEGSKDGNTQID